MTRFSKMEFNESGGLVESEVRVIKQSDILKCPNVILIADHYREDGSCKCNDPNEAVMKDWGYEWKDGRWQ